MKTVLVTGGAGFFGGVLKRTLLSEGMRCISVDICPDEDEHPNLVKEQVDILDTSALDRVFASEPIDGVVHCAAILAHGSKERSHVERGNILGTQNVVEAMSRHSVRQLVFTSTNCLWGDGRKEPISEEDQPKPVEVYGHAKLEAEKIIRKHRGINAVIIRCPTIIDSGRLGLLAILFEFIDEGRRVWTVGGGRNRYQFICGKDLAKACIMALDHPESDTFHIGSDNVKPLAEVYEYAINKSRSKSSVCSLPRNVAIPAMKLAYKLGVSPLGPYHYKMIAEDFVFNTDKIKRLLGWKPTRTNEEMLWDAYRYYSENRREIESRRDVSDHRRATDMGVIRLLKWVS
jgi:UDP-glucose 4-epimerase